jgi:hypothetical protein
LFPRLRLLVRLRHTSPSERQRPPRTTFLETILELPQHQDGPFTTTQDRQGRSNTHCVYLAHPSAKQTSTTRSHSGYNCGTVRVDAEVTFFVPTLVNDSLHRQLCAIFPSSVTTYTLFRTQNIFAGINCLFPSSSPPIL